MKQEKLDIILEKHRLWRCGTGERLITPNMTHERRNMNIINMQDVIQAHNGHWFDADTKRFWGTRLPQVAYETEKGARYFVSSEFRDHRNLSRGYTIRIQLPDGSIGTLSELNEFDTRAQATRALKQLLKGE